MFLKLSGRFAQSDRSLCYIREFTAQSGCGIMIVCVEYCAKGLKLDPPL